MVLFGVRKTGSGSFSAEFYIPSPPTKEKYKSDVPGRMVIPKMTAMKSYLSKHFKSEVRSFIKSNFLIHLLSTSVTASVSLESATVLSGVLNSDAENAPFR